MTCWTILLIRVSRHFHLLRRKPSLDAQPQCNGFVASCEANVSLPNIPEILQRFLLNFKLIACINVWTALIKLFVILSLSVQLVPS